MKKEEILLSDIKRILLGNAPVEFLLEVFIRTIIVYLVLIVVLRIMGKRMSGQLTISEMAVMVTLGAIVSAPMQIPERGIFQAVWVLICALFFQRGLNYIAVKSKKAELIIQGVESVLVKDGVIQLEEMRKNNISRQQLYAALRNGSIYNLGKVDRVYIEASGLFSIFKADDPKPGLSLFPDTDQQIRGFQSHPADDLKVCCYCGTSVPADKQQENCPFCNQLKWTNAVN